jgi:hypothetical protein
MDCEATLDWRFHHGAVRRFDGDGRFGWAAPPAASSQAAISAKPSPLCLKIFSPILRPAPSVRRRDGFRSPSPRRRAIALSIAQGLGPSFAPALNSIWPPDEIIVYAIGRTKCLSIIAATVLIHCLCP